MKNVRVIVCILSAAIVALSSCSLQGKNEHTPSIYLSNFYKNPTDTTPGTLVKMWYNRELDCYVSDTLSIQDSLHVVATVFSYANNLESYCLRFDTASIRLRMKPDPAYDQVLLPQSDRAHGQYYFYPGYNEVLFRFGIMAEKEGLHRIEMQVTSDSEFPTSSVSVALLFVDTIH